MVKWVAIVLATPFLLIGAVGLALWSLSEWTYDRGG